VAVLVARNANKARVCLEKYGVESGRQFCVDAFGRILACHHENVFTFNLVCKEIL
jgi:hypothetical protein